MKLVHRLVVFLSTRRCRGCSDPSPHTHHLTALGRRRYTAAEVSDRFLR